MSRSTALTVCFAAFLLAGCATQAVIQPGTGVPMLPIASNDYYQLVVDPEVVKPGGSQFDCRRPNNASATGVQGALQNFWNNTPNRDILTAISVEYSTDRAISDTFPVLTLKSRNRGKKCSPGTNDISYLSPLLKTASDDNLIFRITAQLEDRTTLDDSLLKGAKDAIGELVRYAGAPDPIASALGEVSREQLGNFTSRTMTAEETVAVGLAPGQAREKALRLVEVDTRSGKLTAGAVAKFQFIGSAIKPMVDLVPALGAINPYTPLQWKIGSLPLPKAVDKATENGWTKYQATTDPVSLNAICLDVQSRLEDNGFSSADASALSWLMIATHKEATAVEAMRRPACLTGPGQKEELERFGINLPAPEQPTPAQAESALKSDGGLFRKFFAATSSIELQVLGERLFAFDAASPITEDADGSLFLAGTRRVPSAESWEAYFPARPVKIQCLTVVDDADFGGITALAVGLTPAGTEVPVAASFASRLPGSGVRVSKITALDEAQRNPATALIGARWASAGQCETADAKPVLVFGTLVPEADPLTVSAVQP
ncbi:hypothetical protein [Hyphomonas sp.]|uniref:hypothetical protein n=1 Tax=Hyphomonas sp. TaxID=87 RepID=UPI0025C72851|nr:hypothetical protein [Hyphomonas sp.]MBI1399426.1 hypothetical protein [Hyphomonas sp.]